MNTCLDCAWFELCEPQDILCACPHFVRPEDVRQEVGHVLYEEWCRYQQTATEHEKSRKDAD